MGALRRSSARKYEPEWVDVRARCTQALALLAGSHLDEATTELVWLWQHMVEHEPSAVGVRISFMASVLEVLVRQHPPARERFLALRDELTPIVDSGEACPDQLQDWAVLCKVVGDGGRVLQWFDRMGPNYEPPRELDWVMECIVIPLLQRRARWADIGRLYREPLRLLGNKYNMVADIPRLTSMHPERAAEMRRSIESGFLADVATMYASLRAARRVVDAQAVLAEARRLMPGDPLENAVSDALEEAKEGSQLPRRGDLGAEPN